MKLAIDRTLEKVVRIPFSGCWIFMGAVNGVARQTISKVVNHKRFKHV
jgi:hypothetical protein